MLERRFQISLLKSHLNAKCVFIACLLLSVFSTSSFAINPNEIREDTEANLPKEIVWPEREFPDPKKTADGFNTGERFQFRGQWGIFRKVAEIVISTEDPNHSNPSLLEVKTEARTTGLIKAVFPLMLKGYTLLDSTEGRILENRVTDEGQSNEKETITRFNFETGKMNHVDKLRPEKNQIKDLPYAAPLDYASAILKIRGWKLEKGSIYPLFISSNGRFYLIEMEAKGTETITTQFGKIKAFRVEPVSAYPQSKIFREGGKMAIWVSADDRRIPLRLDVKTSIGTASMRLEAFTLNDIPILAQSSSN